MADWIWDVRSGMRLTVSKSPTTGWKAKALPVAVQPASPKGYSNPQLSTVLPTAGGVTIIRNVRVVMFPSESVAIAMTEFVPAGKKDPEGGELEIVTFRPAGSL